MLLCFWADWTVDTHPCAPRSTVRLLWPFRTWRSLTVVGVDVEEVGLWSKFWHKLYPSVSSTFTSFWQLSSQIAEPCHACTASDIIHWMWRSCATPALPPPYQSICWWSWLQGFYFICKTCARVNESLLHWLFSTLFVLLWIETRTLYMMYKCSNMTFFFFWNRVFPQNPRLCLLPSSALQLKMCAPGNWRGSSVRKATRCSSGRSGVQVPAQVRPLPTICSSSPKASEAFGLLWVILLSG